MTDHTTRRNRLPRRRRRGAAALEAVLVLSVNFTFVVLLFLLSRIVLGTLYYVISALVGWPY